MTSLTPDYFFLNKDLSWTLKVKSKAFYPVLYLENFEKRWKKNEAFCSLKRRGSIPDFKEVFCISSISEFYSNILYLRTFSQVLAKTLVLRGTEAR